MLLFGNLALTGGSIIASTTCTLELKVFTFMSDSSSYFN